MPNDPRVKFKKKIHDMSHNIIYFQGSGGGGARGSIYEEGGLTPPDPGGGGTDPGGGIDPGGGTGGGENPIYRPAEAIPQPLKPSLNPGEITGITIGSIAAAAALAAALEDQRRRRYQRVPQTENLSSRQSGGGGGRPRSGLSKGLGRAVDNVSQMFEMTTTRPTGPIQPDFLPVSLASSPSSSGAATPLDTPDLQSARSRSSSGASTPEGKLSSIRPDARGFQQQPSALAPTPAPVERPAPPPESIAANTRSRTGTELNQQLELVAGQDAQIRIQDVLIPRQQRSSAGIKLAEADLARTNVPKQEVYLRGRRTTYLNQLKKANNEINRLLSNKQIPEIQRRALLQQQEEYRILIQEADSPRISKTLTTEVNTRAQTPANDNLRATQQTREFESRLRPIMETEMRPLGRQDFPEIGEIVKAAMQQMGSRKPLERARVAQTPQGERIIGPEFSEAHAAGVGIDFNAPRPPPRPAEDRMAKSSEQTPAERPATEQRPEIEPMGSRPPPTETAPEMTRPPKPVRRPQPAPEPIGEEMVDLRTRPAPAPEPVRRPRQVEEMGEEIGSLRAQNAIAEFNDTIDPVLTSAKREGFVIPEAPESIKAQGELAVKKYQYEQALEFAEKEGFYISPMEVVKGERATTGKLRTKKKQLQLFEEVYQRARAQEGGRPRPAAAPAEVRAAAPAEARARAAAAPEARAAAPEAMTARATAAPEVTARSAPSATPEIAARRRMGVPELTAPTPAAPEERASFAERQAFFEKTSKIAPPIEPVGPSPPPSAPASGTATPAEGATVERTTGQQASFGEEVSAGLKGKKVPGRQKVKINSGVTNKGTLNPLEKFVSPQFRNTPNTEINPSAKNLRGALSELGSRVPKLIPSRKVLLNAGANLAAEGGGMAAGFFAGSEAGKAMTKYFATHPPTNRTDEYGQALATSMVALGVGNLVSKAVTYAIRQGVRIAIGAEITGSMSSAGAAGLTAVAEAALFATVATTTQFFVTKLFEDDGYNHAISRTMGSIAATEALVITEIGMWLAKGGPWNPAADVAFIASELFIIGFGIWSAFEEFAEGTIQDQEEETFQAEQRAERARAEQERRDAIATINRTNEARGAFFRSLPIHKYDFDETYARLTDKEKQDLGISDPAARLAFQRDIERAFDPFSSFEKSGDGLQQDPPVLSQLDKDRRDVINSYVNWYIDELRGVRHPPFNFDDSKVRELNEYSGGTWQSAARVTAGQNHLQAERVHPLIEKAQNDIIDAFHKERKTIEQMDELTVRYATLDSTFRTNYEAYIIVDAAAQILVEFNNTQSTYNQVDPALLAIADRDPNFRATADAYYQILANQARDYQMSISDIAHLNSLMETDQAIEIGRLNDARNKIIEKNQSENQAVVDAYNANILREINIYGDNFDAIIRNINEQSLLSGHTFLYASNRADLYRQLHLEVPAIEFVDPGDEVDDTGKPIDATWHEGKGRKAGDTAIYGYRYNLTDEQNQEIEDMITSNQISRFDAEKQGIVIYNRDRAKFMLTDEEKAADLGLSLDAYYKKFGIVDPTVISTELSYSDLQKLYPTQYRELRQKYANDPDADKKIEDTLARGHKRRMDETGGVFTPMAQAADLTVDQLKQMYPTDYNNYLKAIGKKDGDTLTPENIKFIELLLRQGHEKALEAGTAPPVPVENREPTYEELQVMYPEQFDIYNDSNSALGQEDKTEMMLRRLHARRTQAGTAAKIPVPDTPAADPALKNGVVNMPDGSVRIYKNGIVVNVTYGDIMNLHLADLKNAEEINAAEGIQKSDYTPTTGPATTLRQGAITMPDGSKRFYVDGKVVSVDYPPGVSGKTIKEINDSEGVNSVPINNQATDPGGLPTQIETPTQPARELTYEELQVMYPDRFKYYNGLYANSDKYGVTPASPEEQATALEGLLRAEHSNRLENGTAAPAPTPTQPTTPAPNQPLPMVPGARSFEYADSGTQATTTTPTPTTNP